jgi:endonuclease YncB( thermonuclease family)
MRSLRWTARGRASAAIWLLAVTGAPVSLIAQPPAPVWVNLRSGVYHCPGTDYYGKTTRGEYLQESVARERKYRANGGKPCSPAPGDPARPDSESIGAPASPSGRTEECVLERVTDGDTIRCRGLGPVRLIGIDAPETNRDQPFAGTATAALRRLVAAGDTLLLEYDTGKRDRNRRLLAYVWKGQHMLNWMLVRRGLAFAWRFPPDVKNAGRLANAEQLARAEAAGLWSDPRFRCLPLAGRPRSC